MFCCAIRAKNDKIVWFARASEIHFSLACFRVCFVSSCFCVFVSARFAFRATLFLPRFLSFNFRLAEFQLLKLCKFR